ncbi:MAG TPA: alpha-L-arabinofuranosidase C-terminal domain-containing protein [Bacteroidota bacterium]|nr:alpha-L-arabinofuranosidase C-terminal domain-containing protein [Bacteroidota bacterium]
MKTIKWTLLLFIAALCSPALQGQDAADTLTLDLAKARRIISKNIYGHFAEHLGHSIYGGFWVGEGSKIPNVRGIRKDVVEAMKKINAPFLRWPGGCFADGYHWKDGIGPVSSRPSLVNTNWGGVTEDNSFGTHEYLDLCSQIGCAPYISGNLGSGTVQELSEWVEYVNSDNKSPMTDLRKKNGREAPWEALFWGLGNEAWGCGGNMKPEYYSDLALRYGSFMHDYGASHLKKIAVGPSDDDYHWTDVVMHQTGNSIWGLSLHYYTWCNDENATNVTEKSWYADLTKTLRMEEIVKGHSAVMDKYDPGKSVALVVDEWGAWYAVEPGTNPSFLYQQNTLRDALIAGINLNIFNNHCDRVKMAAIAQAVNVLQSVCLTSGDSLVLTPTYHIFDMYKVHQDAILIPSTLSTDSIAVDKNKIPALSASSSLDRNGKIHISLCNLDVSKDERLVCNVESFSVKSVTGQVLTSKELNAHNTFDQPENVTIRSFGSFTSAPHAITVTVPRHSVVVLEVEGTSEVKTAKIDPAALEPGLRCNYFEGSWRRLPDFTELSPVRTQRATSIEIPADAAVTNFGLQFAGYLKVEKDGVYQFSLTSDDGSKLTVDGADIVVNDGTHAMVEQSGSTYLKKGYHEIEVDFFQAGGGSGLSLQLEGPDRPKTPVSADLLFHAK